MTLCLTSDPLEGPGAEGSRQCQSPARAPTPPRPSSASAFRPLTTAKAAPGPLRTARLQPPSGSVRPPSKPNASDLRKRLQTWRPQAGLAPPRSLAATPNPETPPCTDSVNRVALASQPPPPPWAGRGTPSAGRAPRQPSPARAVPEQKETALGAGCLTPQGAGRPRFAAGAYRSSTQSYLCKKEKQNLECPI